MGVEVLYSKERGDFSRATNGVISGKLGYRKPFKDIALGKVNIIIEIGFYSYICDLSLIISLRVVYGRKANSNL